MFTLYHIGIHVNSIRSILLRDGCKSGLKIISLGSADVFANLIIRLDLMAHPIRIMSVID